MVFGRRGRGRRRLRGLLLVQRLTDKFTGNFTGNITEIIHQGAKVVKSGEANTRLGRRRAGIVRVVAWGEPNDSYRSAIWGAYVRRY